MILKYYMYKKAVLIFVGISWIGLASIYLPPTINFLLIIIIGKPLNQSIYLSIYGIAPLTVLCWLIAITNILDVDKPIRVIILAITFILGIIFMAMYYFFLLTDITLLGIFINPYIVKFTLFSRLYFLICLGTFLTTGLIFIKESLKSDNLETKLKAKFLLAAFLSFTVGVILTSSVPQIIIKVIARIILVTSSIEFYMGFLLPERIRKRFLMEDNFLL